MCKNQFLAPKSNIKRGCVLSMSAPSTRDGTFGHNIASSHNSNGFFDTTSGCRIPSTAGLETQGDGPSARRSPALVFGLELRDAVFFGVPGGVRGGVAPFPFTRLSPANTQRRRPDSLTHPAVNASLPHPSPEQVTQVQTSQTSCQ